MSTTLPASEIETKSNSAVEAGAGSAPEMARKAIPSALTFDLVARCSVSLTLADSFTIYDGDDNDDYT